MDVLKSLFILEKTYMQDKRHRILCAVLMAIISGIGLVLSLTYRPYIYSHHISDFHFADTIGNIFAVPAAYLLFFVMFKNIKYTKSFILLLVFICWTLYELLLSNTFDWYDILATFIMCVIMYPLLIIIERHARISR